MVGDKICLRKNICEKKNAYTIGFGYAGRIRIAKLPMGPAGGSDPSRVGVKSVAATFCPRGVGAPS